MIATNELQILSAVARLRGASPEEIAADIGLEVEAVCEGIKRLKQAGYLFPVFVGTGNATGDGRLPQVARVEYLGLTPLGRRELQFA